MLLLLLLLLLLDIPGQREVMGKVEALVLLLQVTPCILRVFGAAHRQSLGSSSQQQQQSADRCSDMTIQLQVVVGHYCTILYCCREPAKQAITHATSCNVDEGKSCCLATQQDRMSVMSVTNHELLLGNTTRSDVTNHDRLSVCHL